MMRFCLLLVMALSLALGGCAAGAKKEMSLKELRYPVSMSPSLYGPNDAVLRQGKELEVVDRVTYQKSFWGLAYGLIPLSGDSDVAEAINAKVAERNGAGVINMEVTATGCFLNKYWTYTLVGFLPFLPGCADTVVTGDVVRVKN